MKKKKLAILGSTGSIGTQTLQVVAEHPDLYEVRILTANTQADMLIGQECIVTELIDNVAGTGAVSVGGKVWTARTTDDHVIPQGSHATVLRIEGVKLIVNPVRETADAEA